MVTEQDLSEVAGKILQSRGADPFQTLLLSRDASLLDAKLSFRKLALLFHPDKCQHRACDEIFKAVSAAYYRISGELSAELSGGPGKHTSKWQPLVPLSTEDSTHGAGNTTQVNENCTRLASEEILAARVKWAKKDGLSGIAAESAEQAKSQVEIEAQPCSGTQRRRHSAGSPSESNWPPPLCIKGLKAVLKSGDSEEAIQLWKRSTKQAACGHTAGFAFQPEGVSCRVQMQGKAPLVAEAQNSTASNGVFLPEPKSLKTKGCSSRTLADGTKLKRVKLRSHGALLAGDEVAQRKRKHAVTTAL